MSTTRWVAMHCGDETAALLANYPNAFLLLAQIAMRAKWKDCPITGMQQGEAFIGDWRAAGLHSKKAYEVAKSRLETCKLATFQGGNRGTRATLVDSTIFSLSAEPKGEPREEPRGTKGEPKGEPRGNPRGTNHTDTQSTPTQNTLFPLDESGQASPRKSKARGTLEELKTFAVEIGAEAGDGETCFDTWEGNGWTNNGKPVKDWRATMKAWNAKGYLASQKRQAAGRPATSPSPPGSFIAGGRLFKPTRPQS